MHIYCTSARKGLDKIGIHPVNFIVEGTLKKTDIGILVDQASAWRQKVEGESHIEHNSVMLDLPPIQTICHRSEALSHLLPIHWLCLQGLGSEVLLV